MTLKKNYGETNQLLTNASPKVRSWTSIPNKIFSLFLGQPFARSGIKWDRLDVDFAWTLPSWPRRKKDRHYLGTPQKRPSSTSNEHFLESQFPTCSAARAASAINKPHCLLESRRATKPFILVQFSDGVSRFDLIEAERQSEPPRQLLHVSVLLWAVVELPALLADRVAEKLRRESRVS